MGSIYLILATNLGARLGFLVALCGLSGWMALMGGIWAVYGIGLQGPLGSWQAVEGRTVLQDTAALNQAGLLGEPVEVPDEMSYADEASLVAETLVAEEGWNALDPSSPAAGQAGASAGEFLEETGTFEAGDYQVARVFDIGGDRSPMIGSFDLLAFRHGRAMPWSRSPPSKRPVTSRGGRPRRARSDESRQRQYVYMIRDLGARRQPAISVDGRGVDLFLTLCWLLHERDARVRTNLGQPAPAPSAGS